MTHSNLILQSLELYQYRNHSKLYIEFDKNINLIYGKNGIGKTNILESISLLAPGKGLRNAQALDIYQHNSSEWVAKADFEDFLIKTGCTRHSSKRKIFVNDEELIRHMEVLDYVNVCWFVPQMDQMFLDQPSVRRKFLDRMTFNIFKEHALMIANYEKLTKTRMLVLKDNGDRKWLSSLEKQMATLNIAISKNRSKALEEISSHFSDDILHKPELSISNLMDDNLTEEEIIKKLCDNRRIDLLSKRTNFGVHKSDLLVTYNNIKANLCSTGEQKFILISILLAHVRSLNKRVLFLLDEIFSHLDEQNSLLLLQNLKSINAQIWITTANLKLKDILDIKHINL